MRDLTFTVYRSARDRNGTPVTRTWDRWLERLTQHEVRGNPSDSGDKGLLDRAKDGPCVILAEVPGVRRKSSVRKVHALSLDLEDMPEAELLDVLKTLTPFEYVAYTTHKSGAEAVGGETRLRVIIPLVEPIDPEDHPRAWSGLDELIGNANDPQTKDSSRLNYLPTTFDSGKAWTHRHRGRWLKLTDLPIPSSAPGSTVQTPEQVKRAAGKLRHALRSMSKDDAMKDAARALIDGLSFAESGKRHETILSLTWWLVDRPDPPTEAVVGELFAPSISTMREANPGDPPTLEEVFDAYRGALAKTEEHRNDREREEEQKRHDKARTRQLESTQSGPYLDTDLARIAEAQKCEPEQLKDRWIIQRDAAYWLLDASGSYRGAYAKEDAEVATIKILGRAPVRLIEATQQGYRYRPLPSVVRESGQVAEHVVADLTARATWFEINEAVLHEAVCPIRDLPRILNPKINEWLKIMCGPMYQKVIDWLSCVPDLTKLLCAIYFDGKAGGGKTLFAHGLAQLWTKGSPSKPDEVLDGFNDDLTRCPLIFADEKVTAKRQFGHDVTTSLREMIGSTARTLNRKYRKPMSMIGAIRMILAANNKSLLDSRDVASAHDLEAVAQRFLHIPISPRATEFMEAMSKTEKTQWLHGGIASHALWLMDNHHVENPGRRFWVEGEIDEMHRILLTANRINAMVNQCLVAYLMAPQSYDRIGTGLIRRGGGRLLVNAQAVIEMWETYLPKTKHEAELSKINSALRAIALSETRPRLRFKGKRVRYHDIDVDNLITYSDREGFGDRDEILKQVTTDEEPIDMKDDTNTMAGIPPANDGNLPL